MEPIYTPASCKAAYQLDWSSSLFWHDLPGDAPWFADLQRACEPDGLRLLQHEFRPPSTSQFLVSSQPHVPPQLLAQRVKGRLQHLVRHAMPSAFRRNYAL